MDKRIIKLYKLEPTNDDSLEWKFRDYPKLYIRTTDQEDRYRLILFAYGYWATMVASKEIILDKSVFDPFVINELKRTIEKARHTGNRVTITKMEKRDLG